jgi:phage gp46-like protein
MPDPRVLVIRVPDPIASYLDWVLLPNGLLDDTQALATAVTVALGTDARADANDALPDFSDDLRGWWGDLDADELYGGWPIGSRLWLMTRAKITDERAREGATVGRIDRYIREALDPFVENGIATSYTVAVTRDTSDRNKIVAEIVIYRGPKSAIALRYQSLWDEIGAG